MPRGDGRLSHDLLPGEKGPQDACGVIGVWAPGEEVAKLAYFGLYALQHRGQEAAGIAVSNGRQITVYKDMGLVAQVFDESSLGTLKGHIAVGHARYSTTGGSTWENAQPTLGPTAWGTVALGHNGNLTNSEQLRERVVAHEAARPRRRHPHRGQRARARQHHRHRPHHLAAGQRPEQPAGGDRPLGPRRPRGRVLAGVHGRAHPVRGPRPARRPPARARPARPRLGGRLGDRRRWTSSARASSATSSPASSSPSTPTACAPPASPRPSPRAASSSTSTWPGPDSRIAGTVVHTARVRMGRSLAAGAPRRGRPRHPRARSPARPAAIGYADASGIPYAQGLVKNSYVGRTFIAPSQTLRQLGIRLKLNPLREVIQGKRLVVVDDSIVRGNTQRALVRMLREAGAAEVHVRISSAPVTWPCFYGIDFASRAELIATGPRRGGDPGAASARTPSATSATTRWSPRPSSPRTSSARPASPATYPIAPPRSRAAGAADQPAGVRLRRRGGPGGRRPAPGPRTAPAAR